MPPDIIAGLIAPTGPPGAAGTDKAAELPASRIGSAAVFAALLTQSRPPDLKLAVPEIDAAPAVKLGSAAKPQLSKNPKTFSTWKTMDTLPPLLFPPAGTAMKASELPLLNAPSHKSSADDSKTDAAKAPAMTPGAAASVPNSPLNLLPIAVTATVPAHILAASVQAVLLPAPAPASAVPAASVPVHAASVSAEPASAPSAVPETRNAAAPSPIVAAAAPLASLLVSTPAPSLVLPQFGPAAQPAVRSNAAPSGVPLPPTWTLPAPAPAQTLPPILSRSTLPVTPLTTAAVPEPAKLEPAKLEPTKSAAGSAPVAVLQAVLPAVQSARTSPLTVAHAALQSPITPLGQTAPQVTVLPQAQAAPQVTVLPQVQAAPQGAALPPTPNLASPALGLASLMAASVLAESASEPATLLPAKSAGKLGQIALKPASQNADINTRTLLLNAPQAAEKTAPSAVVSAKTPAPASSSQNQKTSTDQADGSKKPPETGSTFASNTLLAAQTVPLEAQRASLDGKPLTAADHAAMVHQVADGVGAMPPPPKPDGVQQISLQLHPKDWGSLQVSVSVTPGQEPGAAKTVTAHLVAETPQVKAALQSQTGALHQALRASGLNLEHLTVSVKPTSEAVKPAAQSASSGFSGGQGQFSAGTSQAHPAQTTPGSQPSGTQLGTSAGSSQNGRKEQPPASASSTARAEAAQEEITPVRQTVRLSGRIDTHA